MSDNEYEKFEISDYDLENEFNINRPRRTFSKHQQIYGIWADDSDNDSDNGDMGSSRKGRGGGRQQRKKDYTAPVSFVAGGVQQAGKKDKDQDKNDDEDDDDESRPAFGRLMNDDNSTSNDEDEPVQISKQKPTRTFAQHSSTHSVGNNLGTWEKHTRGIGAKLLLQMGYQPGKGLGKDLQGISQPVEAQVRKGRGAIGAYGPETPATIGKQPKKVENERISSEEMSKEKRIKWKKNEGGTKQHYYRSVDEVIKKGSKSTKFLAERLNKQLSNVPVIDMTGPEKRVLSGYHAISHTKMQDEELYESAADVGVASADTKSEVNFAVPELLHNIQLIVDMCEQDIINLDKMEREAIEKKEALMHESKNIEKIAALEKNHISTLERTVELVDELSYSENLTLDRAEKIFLTLKHDYAAEYEEFQLADLAAGVIAPLVKISLENWQPLQQPTKYIELIKRWKSILVLHEHDMLHVSENSSRNVFDPYSSLIWAGVIPSFRACATNWNPKQHQPMAALLDAWAPLFPSWILDSVLEQVVLTRICTEVREWDPLTDIVPIHIWILPWSAILGKKMEEFVFPTIRQKLGTALQAWLPQDRSARAMISPWKNTFNETNSISDLIGRGLLP